MKSCLMLIGTLSLIVLSVAQGQFGPPTGPGQFPRPDQCSVLCSPQCADRIQSLTAVIQEYEGRCGKGVALEPVTCTPGRSEPTKFYLRNTTTKEVRHNTGFLNFNECLTALQVRRVNLVCTRGNSDPDQFFIRDLVEKQTSHNSGFQNLEECTFALFNMRGNVTCTRGNSDPQLFFMRDLTTKKVTFDTGFPDLNSCLTSLGFIQ